MSKTKREKRSKLALAECSLPELLEVFNAFPDLFSCDDQGATMLLDRLKLLVDREREKAKRDDARALLTWGLILRCRELLKIEGRPGFEWVGDEFRKMLDRQAIARNYGLVESDLYQTTGKRRKEQRKDLTLRGLLRIALKKIGRPTELARDLQRAALVKTIQASFGLKIKKQALRFVAGLEAVQKTGREAIGRRIRVNVGGARPRFIIYQYPFLVEGLTEDELKAQSAKRVFEVDPSDHDAHQIDRSLKNIKKRGLESLEFRDRRYGKPEEWHGAIIPIPRSSKTVLELAGHENQLTDKLRTRVEHKGRKGKTRIYWK